MSRFTYSGIVALALSLQVIASASADVTIDPTQYTVGTVLTTVTPGVVLTAPNSGNNVLAVGIFSDDTQGKLFGTFSFVYNNFTYYTSDFTQSQPLQAAFATAPGSITVDFALAGNGGDTGYGIIDSYDSKGKLISETDSSINAASLTVPGAGVSYITTFTAGDSDYDVTGISGISFSPGVSTVPEAGNTLSQLSLAFIGIALLGRVIRRNQSVAIPARVRAK